ncbi:hypothetical protein DVK02_12865 [Halobellus sp. Atlit-31R]|nr:hypothetical protein DVK02_12865 [Halobellus sp. Atlit-31R]
MRKQIFAGLLAMLVVASGFAPMAAAAGGGLNYADGKAPNASIDADVTVDAYEVSWADSLRYENDNGEAESLPAELNRSTEPDELGNGTVNPFTYTVTDVDFSDAGEFPREGEEDNAASALDASEWTTASGASVNDSTTAPGVDAVQYTASMAGQTATYSNFSITSDAEKRYLQAFYDVSSSGANQVDLVIHDATDGDTANVKLLNTGASNADANDVGATTTGEGKAIQVQIGQLEATGGDNSIDEIGKVVIFSDGAATVDLSALNLEKTGKWKLGTRNVDTDTDDDDLETEDVYQATGPISIDSISTMGAAFDDATIMGVTFPAEFDAANVADADVEASFESDNAYPNWDVVGDITYRLELPSAYDLSYANTELSQTTQWPGTRYATVEYAEGVDEDTEFSEIDSWTDLTASYDAQDKAVAIDDTVSVDTGYVLHFELKLTNDEAGAMQSTAGGGAGPMASSGGFFGGLISWLWGLPGVVLGALGIGAAAKGA